MNNKNSLKLLMPHIFYAKWKVDEKKIKEYIQKFGYWAWEHSKPALKVIINDKNILREQNSSFIHLSEGDSECVFFVPLENKLYRTEYGRLLGKDLFIPMSSSNSTMMLRDEYEEILRLPNSFLKLTDTKWKQ